MKERRRRGNDEPIEKLSELPSTVRNLVVDFVADYNRRLREIKGTKISDEIRDHFVALNKSIDEAAATVDAGLVQILIDDIASTRGYDKSLAHCMMSMATYYKYKRLLMFEIAKKLQLYG